MHRLLLVLILLSNLVILPSEGKGRVQATARASLGKKQAQAKKGNVPSRVKGPLVPTTEKKVSAARAKGDTDSQVPSEPKIDNPLTVEGTLIKESIGRGLYERKTVDKVIAIIYHSDGSELILQSDLRPDLSDAIPSLEDVVLKKLIILDGKKLKIPVSDAEVDRHVARVQEQLKMTREDLTAFFKERGFSFEDGRKELEKNLLIETTIEQRVKSKAFVPQTEIEKYHKEHPLTFYDVKQRFIPFDFGSKAIQRAVIDRDIESGALAQEGDWGNELTLKDADISFEKAFIKELEPGAVVRIQETDEGTSLLQMIRKRETPFEERKQEIQMALARERYMKALQEYYDSLLEQKRDTRVRYIDASQRPIRARAQHQVGAPS